MELKRVLGNRRSIRYYLPHRPVERDKVEKMLEAARHASCVGNVNNTKAVVIWKEECTPELIKAITPPLGYQQMQTAPCFILWYHDKAAYQVDKWIGNMMDLADQRRIGISAEETKQTIDRNLRPQFTAAWKNAAEAPLAYMDVGQAVCQATLVAYDEGLGTCLMSSPRIEQFGKLLDLPETAVPVCWMSVGYPAESAEAGGQTQKAPFDSLFCEMETGRPFKRNPAVQDELKAAGMVQRQAPLPWRDAEMEYLKVALKLEDRLAAQRPPFPVNGPESKA